MSSNIPLSGPALALACLQQCEYCCVLYLPKKHKLPPTGTNRKTKQLLSQITLPDFNQLQRNSSAISERTLEECWTTLQRVSWLLFNRVQLSSIRLLFFYLFIYLFLSSFLVNRFVFDGSRIGRARRPTPSALRFVKILLVV